MNEREYVATERAAIITVHLVIGYALTTAQAAALLGMSDEGARQMLGKIARVQPVSFEDGVWRWCGERYARRAGDRK